MVSITLVQYIMDRCHKIKTNTGSKCKHIITSVCSDINKTQGKFDLLSLGKILQLHSIFNANTALVLKMTI